MLNHPWAFQLPLAHTPPPCQHISFLKSWELGAHTPIRRSWQVSADKKPTAKESPFLCFTFVMIKVLNIYIPHGRLWKAGERTRLSFPEGVLFTVSPTPRPVYLWSFEADFRKDDIIDCEKIFGCMLPHLFIIKCFSTTPPHRNGNGPRAGDELHSYRTRDCASQYLFSFLLLVSLFKPSVMRTFPWAREEQIKNSEGTSVFFHMSQWGGKIHSTNTVFYLHSYVTLSRVTVICHRT